MIDNFKIGAELGEGCSAKVYHGVRLSDNKEFALKVYEIGGSRSECHKKVQSLLDEVEVMSILDHENIIKYESHSEKALYRTREGKVRHVAYIAMELASNGDL